MKKFILLFIVMSAACIHTQAQNSYSLQYAVGIPTGDLDEFIDQASFRGMYFEYQYELTPQFAVGFGGGFNTFYKEKSYDTYTEGTVSLSGVQYRYTNSFPIIFNLAYYYDMEATVTPYASFGLGTLYSDRRVDIGLFESKTQEWQFALQPEVGVLVNTLGGVGIKIAGKYNQAFDTSDLNGQSFLSINVGLVFDGGY